jgi:hypothetical protein
MKGPPEFYVVLHNIMLHILRPIFYLKHSVSECRPEIKKTYRGAVVICDENDRLTCVVTAATAIS